MNYILKDSNDNFINRIVWNGVDIYPLPDGWTLTLDS